MIAFKIEIVKNVRARNWLSWSTNSSISDHIWTFHDSAFKTVMPLEWLEVHAWYYTLHDILNNDMVWSDWQLKSPTSTQNNDELVNGFTHPSSFTTQVSWQQRHLRTPWQCIQQFDVSSSGCEYMHAYWCIVLLHALTNHFRNEFCNNTSRQNNSRLMSASHCTLWCTSVQIVHCDNDKSQLRSNLFTN